MTTHAARMIPPDEARNRDDRPPPPTGAPPSPESDGVDPLERYAAGIDTSDYVTRVAPLIQAAVPSIGELLDIGAGGGQLGAYLRVPSRAWSVVEPAPVMQRRLQALDPAPRLVRSGWKESGLPAACADTVLAANMPAPLTEPAAFLAQCQAWARRSVVWLVPAQHGPRGICLAGCLPQTWHREDETPGVAIVLRGLSPGEQPAIVAEATWTFTAVVSDLARTARSLADRLGWTLDDLRRSDLFDHLAAQAVPVPAGHRLSVPRTSAVLVWRTHS